MAALDESFKRPGSVPFKWELQPGIPKQQQQAAAGDRTAALPPAPTTPRLAPPPARAASTLSSSASCRRSSAAVSSALLSPLSAAPSPPSHRRSMSARFATSLVLPFTRRHRDRRRGQSRDDADFCMLYGDSIA